MKYIVQTNGEGNYLPLQIIIEIVDYEGPVMLDPLQDKQIISQFVQMLSNQNPTVWTEEEFIEMNEKMKGLVEKLHKT